MFQAILVESPTVPTATCSLGGLCVSDMGKIVELNGSFSIGP